MLLLYLPALLRPPYATLHTHLMDRFAAPCLAYRVRQMLTSQQSARVSRRILRCQTRAADYEPIGKGWAKSRALVGRDEFGNLRCMGQEDDSRVVYARAHLRTAPTVWNTAANLTPAGLRARLRFEISSQAIQHDNGGK